LYTTALKTNMLISHSGEIQCLKEIPHAHTKILKTTWIKFIILAIK